MDCFSPVHKQNRTESKTIFDDDLPKDIQESFENFDKVVLQRRNRCKNSIN